MIAERLLRKIGACLRMMDMNALQYQELISPTNEMLPSVNTSVFSLAYL